MWSYFIILLSGSSDGICWPYTVTQPPGAGAVDTRQDGHLHAHLIVLNSILSKQLMMRN